jgi:hypothetical protein
MGLMRGVDVARGIGAVARPAMVLAIGGAIGCGGPGLDPDVPPVTEGDWYRPALGVTWQWQLTGTPNTSYDVELYDLDLFETDAAVIADLHARGRRVLCYFSAGSSEDWRPDYDRFTRADRGRKLDGWAGERWLDIRSENVLAIMLDRLDLAVDKGCDGVEPDNMEAYNEPTGFRLTADDQLGWNKRIANEAHLRGLAVALKNDGTQAIELVDYFDLDLNEQCHQYDECEQLAPFTDAGKPILNAEYPGSESAAEAAREELCAKAASASTRTLILPLDLDDSFRVSCDA